jgi:RNA polymerase sigma-70 factor (ECF subfamily)
LRGASSLLASAERVENEEERLAAALRRMLDDWRDAGDYVRVKCLELLIVCGWANKDVAQRLGLTEQQVANWKFQAVERLQRKAAPGAAP